MERKELEVDIEWLGFRDIQITLSATGERLEFIEGHNVNLIYAKHKNKQITIETEKPWLMSGKGQIVIMSWYELVD